MVFKPFIPQNKYVAADCKQINIWLWTFIFGCSDRAGTPIQDVGHGGLWVVKIFQNVSDIAHSTWRPNHDIITTKNVFRVDKTGSVDL